MLRFTPEPEKSSGPFASCLYFVRTSAQTTSDASRSPPQDLLRRQPVLHPVHQCAEEVLGLRSAAAAAVPDTRGAEQPIKLLDAFEVEESAERWTVLGAGLFDGKVRAVIATLDGRANGVSTDKVRIRPGQMKLFYVLQGTVACATRTRPTA
jgi:hypothetical protein